MKCEICGKTGLKDLQAHNRNSHGGSEGFQDVTFGGQIGRALDPGTSFNVLDVVNGNSNSSVGTIRILPKGQQKTVHVFRETGIPVVRKVGDRTRHEKEWA